MRSPTPAASSRSTVPCSSTPARIALLDVLAAARLEHDRLDALRAAAGAPASGPAGPAPTMPTCVRISPRPCPLEQRGLALADADAQRREPVAAAAAAQLVRERDDEPGAAHAERVAERDRAAVDVHALLVEAEVAHDGEALRGEGLVQLDQVDVADLHARARQQLAHGGNRPDAHDARVDARDGAAGEAPRAARCRARGPAPRSRSRAPRRRR